MSGSVVEEMIEAAPTILDEHESLPEGWRSVRLDEVCERYTGIRDPRLDPEKQFRYVDISSVDNKTKRIFEAKNLLNKNAPSRARQVIRAGDVIVATTRPNLNAVALVPPELDDQICSTGFCVLRAGEELNRDYLFAYVQSREFVEPLAELVKGALYPAVTDGQVRSQYIPLPPLDEQKRIAAMLTKRMAAVERARVATEAQLKAAKALPAAYLRSVFESPESSHWERRKLGEICEITSRQVDPKIPEYGALPHVNGENIERGTCRLLYLRTAAEDNMKSGKYLFEAGNVLYSKLRPYLRKVVVADFRGVCSADMYPIRANPNLLDSEFLAWTLVSDEFTAYADDQSRRARMPKLNREQLFAWSAPLPSLTEQKSIATNLKRQMAGADAASKKIQAQLDAIERLPAALLREAFAGKL